MAKAKSRAGKEVAGKRPLGKQPREPARLEREPGGGGGLVGEILGTLSEDEQNQLARFAQQMKDKREHKKQSTRRCSMQGCNKPMNAVGDHLICDTCKVRIKECVTCGDGTSPFLCPECIANGAATCAGCLRPAPNNNSFCPSCRGDYAVNNAGHFKENVAPPTPGAEQRAGVLSIPPPGTPWTGGEVQVG